MANFAGKNRRSRRGKTRNANSAGYNSTWTPKTENTEEGGDPRTRHLDHYILPEERVGLLQIARAHGAAPSLRRRTRSDKERSDASQAETVRGFKSVQPAERVRSDCSAPVEWTWVYRGRHGLGVDRQATGREFFPLSRVQSDRVAHSAFCLCGLRTTALGDAGDCIGLSVRFRRKWKSTKDISALIVGAYTYGECWCVREICF
jgi:hypothetical protein